MTRAVCVAYGALVTASLMWPSEGAIQGNGGHLIVLWLLLAGVAMLVAGPRGSGWSRRLPVLAVLLLVAGFWASTWHVFDTGGNRRAAVNLTFAWTAAGAAWWLTSFVVRQVGFRPVVALLVSLAVGAAVQGICQHHVVYAGQAEWYRTRRTALDESIAAGVSGALERHELEAEFRQMDIPLDGPRRDLFERRLLGSSEPVGPFALANSLGGLLAVGFIALCAAVVAGVRQETRLSVTAWIGIAIAFAD